MKERLLSRPKIKQRRSGRTDALSKCTSLSPPPPSLTTRFPGPIRHRSDAARKARKGTSDRSITHSTTSHTRKDRGTFRRKTVQQRQMVNLRLRLPPVTAWKKVLEFIEGPRRRLNLTLPAMVIKPVCSPRLRILDDATRTQVYDLLDREPP